MKRRHNDAMRARPAMAGDATFRRWMSVAYAPQGNYRYWYGVDPGRLASQQAFMQRSGFGEYEDMGAVLPEARYDIQLVPITQPPPPLPASALQVAPIPLSARNTMNYGQPSKFDVWANRITGLAQQAANIVQQFRTPSGQTVTYAVPADQLAPPPASSVGAGVQLGPSGARGELKISNEMLLIGGLVLVVLLSRRK